MTNTTRKSIVEPICSPELVSGVRNCFIYEIPKQIRNGRLGFIRKINFRTNSMNRKLKLLLLVFFFIQVNVYSKSSIFNQNLSDSDFTRLENGDAIIKKLKTLKESSIQSENKDFLNLLDSATKIKPVYIAEIIKTYPYNQNENLPEEFSKKIMDIPSYVGIPYYSEQGDAWYDLYSSANIVLEETFSNEIVSNETASNSTEIIQKVLADLEMEPFGLIKTQIETKQTKDSFYYESVNLNKLKYDEKFTCVQPNKMKSIICIFRHEDKWILYGVGVVNAPDVFFLRSRIETSFINRIKTFCSYFFTFF